MKVLSQTIQKLRPSNKIQYSKLLKGMFKLFKNAEETDAVFEISDALRNSNATRAALEYLKTDAALQAVMTERYLGPDWKLEELQSYPEHSVGKHLYNFLSGHQFTPDTFRKPQEIKDDIDYLEFRLRKTHDVWHVLGGFKTDVIGELGIQAFRFGQVRLPLSIILIAGGLFQILKSNPEELPKAFNEISRGWSLGSQSKSLLAIKWEENWQRPILEMKSELGLLKSLN